jgi:hypothetical protein
VDPQYLRTYLSCTYLLKMGVLWPQGQHEIPWKQGSGMEKHFPWNFHGFHGKFSMDTTSMFFTSYGGTGIVKGCSLSKGYNNQDNNGVQTHTQTLYTYQYVMDSQITDGGLSCIVSHQGPSQD